ncbi:MAG: hypothetical protein ACTHN5_03500 [Phycisphaerae bacterium]
MIRRTLFTTLAVLAVTSLSAFGDAKEDLTAAINKTADAANYSWTTNVEGGFGGGQTQGKAEKDGYVWAELPGRDAPTEMVKKGKTTVVKTEDGWKTTEELTAAAGDNGGGRNPQRFLAMMAANFQPPLQQAQEAVKGLENVKAEGDGFTANLSEEAAKQMLTFRRGRRGGNGGNAGPQVSNAKVEVHAWTKDGMISKVQYHATGTFSFNGNDRDIDRTTTVEIKDVGTTKVEVPAEAKKKLEGSDAPKG